MKNKFFSIGRIAMIIIASVVLVSLAGCGDKSTPTPTPSKTELICKGKWEIASLPIEPALDLGGGVKLTDYTQMLQDCEKDNFYAFKADNTYTLDEGLLKCNPADPQTKPGVWSLSADGKIFTLDGEKAILILIDDNNLHTRVDSFLQNSSLTAKFRKRP
ncbi:MAG: DUF5004 domain-containing protein [Flavobacteriaceae bacterium]|nr:DUF5004 domain-containing protein [Flavobacteriaceae bacterium]PHX77944.1 MAG: hypothetical protein CK543_00570 [Flavobacteriales bacterium]